MKILKENYLADIYCDQKEAGSIWKAVADLRQDLKKNSGNLAQVFDFLPGKEDGTIVIGCLQNERFLSFVRSHNLPYQKIEHRWEGFIIQTFGDRNENIVIMGSDPRGTIYGIYDFCERFLGVDPLYFWTDFSIQQKDALEIEQVYIEDYPKTYRFRGWFINDEDFLTDWKEGGGRRNVDYPFYHQVVHPSVFERVLETALRCKINLIIPASLMNIDNPDEEKLIQMASERGLFVSQHHIEPIGVSHFTWDEFWNKRGQKLTPSFIQYPEKFREIWTYYAKKWAQYPNVIWQLGLRGRGDRPVWFHDSMIPDSSKERGELISRAIRMQTEVLQEVLGHNDFLSTVTLWLEGARLFEEGSLSIPESSWVVFSDIGQSQMMGNDFFKTERQSGRGYGIYYHLAFWSYGPHMVQGTSIEKLYQNVKHAVEKGDQDYFILNVSNIREFVMGIDAAKKITWDFEGWSCGKLVKEWSLKQFGYDCTELYQQYFEAFVPIGQRGKLLLECAAFHMGKQMIQFTEQKIESPLFDACQPVDGLGYDFFRESTVSSYFEDEAPRGFTPEQFVLYYQTQTEPACGRWSRLLEQTLLVRDAVSKERRGFFTTYLIGQIQLVKCIYEWSFLIAGVAQYVFSGDYIQALEIGAKALHQVKEMRLIMSRAEQGKWEHWYRGDRKVNLRQAVDMTDTMLQKIEEKMESKKIYFESAEATKHRKRS